MKSKMGSANQLSLSVILFIFTCVHFLNAAEYYEWPKYDPTVAYDYVEEYGILPPPTKVLDDVTNDNSDPVETYIDRWWCFRWGSDANPAISEAAWVAMLERFNDDFDYITNIMRWPRDKRAQEGYYSTIYLYGSGLSTDNASNTDGGGWQGTTWYNGQAWPMVLASYIPVVAYAPDTYDGYQTGAMIHEGIHSILSSMPGCKNACWFQEGGNTWLQGTMESQRNGSFDSIGWLSVGAAIAPFMPIECYTGWLQDGSFGGPCAEGVNMFEGDQQICTWRRLLGGTQYGECFPHALEVILGPKSVAWVWRNCDESGRLLQDLAEAPGGLGEEQTRRLIMEYRARQAFCDFGQWSYAFRKLLNDNWGTVIGPEWEPVWIDCDDWNATCYADSVLEGNVLNPVDLTLPGWSGANQIPLRVDPDASEATITFNPIGTNMACQLVYRDTDGEIHYSEPVNSGTCSIPLANVRNNVIIAVACNTDYIYHGESSRTAKFDYSLTLESGITGKADIYTRWYDYNPNRFSIEASSEGNGSISPSGSIGVNAGSTQTFTFIPADGYEVDQVLLNGFPIGSLDNYSFRNIHGDHTIGVIFKSRIPATIKFQSEEPEYSSEDEYNLTESNVSTENVGAGNRAATYVHQNETSIGQTFITGDSLSGYTLSGIWLKHVNYDSATGDGTTWDINNADAEVQVRISAVHGTTLSKMQTEDYTISGIETGNELMPDDSSSGKSGTGTWIYFDLGSYLTLNPATQYAFDITVLSSGNDFYFETAGVNTNSYTTGSAYSTTAKSALDMGTVFNGDHTFIVDLIDKSDFGPCNVQYDFEDNLNDISGNGIDASANGSPAYAQGYVNSKSVDLNANNYLSLPNEAVNHADITVATWVYWNGGGNWQRIFDFGNNTTQYMFLSPSSGSNTLRFAITTNSNGGEQVIETSQLPSNQWVHVAVTLKGNTGTLYVNGAAVSSNDNITLNVTDFDPQNNYIGNSQWPDPLFNGKIDDFRIYDHALSSSEIGALYIYGTNSNIPSFMSNPFDAENAIEGSSYIDLAANYAVDPQNKTLSFSKEFGPEWLTIDTDGSISGTPQDRNVGQNTFFIRAENESGLSRTVVMNVDVANIYSGLHGIEDLTALVAQWLQTDCIDVPACEGTDLNGDTKVDMADFSVLTEKWLKNEYLQLHLTFDNPGSEIIDSSLYNRSCQPVNEPIKDPAGYINGAMQFDGDDYIEISDYKGISGSKPRTVAAWIKVGEDLTNTDKINRVIMSWGKAASISKMWQLIIDNNTGKLAVAIYGARLKGGQDLEDGLWHHVAAVLPYGARNLNQVKLYVDGIQISTNATEIDLEIDTTTFESVLIGALDSEEADDLQTPKFFFEGAMDDVRIYDTDLSSEEIAVLASQQ